jgi:hypothetical protein
MAGGDPVKATGASRRQAQAYADMFLGFSAPPQPCEFTVVRRF